MLFLGFFKDKWHAAIRFHNLLQFWVVTTGHLECLPPGPASLYMVSSLLFGSVRTKLCQFAGLDLHPKRAMIHKNIVYIMLYYIFPFGRKLIVCVVLSLSF